MVNPFQEVKLETVGETIEIGGVRIWRGDNVLWCGEWVSIQGEM